MQPSAELMAFFCLLISYFNRFQYTVPLLDKHSPPPYNSIVSADAGTYSFEFYVHIHKEFAVNIKLHTQCYIRFDY